MVIPKGASNGLTKKFKYSPAIILGVCTFVADLLVHPTHFYQWYSEALATGIGAGLLSAFFIYRGEKNELG